MRRNGVNLPAPNVSGRGAIFNTTGIDKASANYGAAAKKCAFGIPGGTHAPSIRPGKTDKIHVEKIDPTKIHIGKIDPTKIHIEKITPAAPPGIVAPPASSPPK
jgi:hypothetical protein